MFSWFEIWEFRKQPLPFSTVCFLVSSTIFFVILFIIFLHFDWKWFYKVDDIHYSNSDDLYFAWKWFYKVDDTHYSNFDDLHFDWKWFYKVDDIHYSNFDDLHFDWKWFYKVDDTHHSNFDDLKNQLNLKTQSFTHLIKFKIFCA